VFKLFFSFFLFTATLHAEPKLNLVLDTNLGEPIWGFDFYSDKQMLFSTKSGKVGVYRFKPAEGVFYLKGVPKVFSAGQGGLLDLKVFHFDAESKWVYITYSSLVGDTSKSQTRVARFKPDFDAKKITQFEVIFESMPPVSSTKHFGSRVELSSDKKFIFVSVGERGERDRAQDLNQHYGKVLRLNVNGSLPKTNPYFNKDRPVQTAVWTWGHRNPQGMDRIPDTEEILVQEHGPRGGDEINWVQKGKNYGWPVITYGKEYWGPSIGAKKKEGFEQPLYHFTPSIAPSGLLVYSGKLYPEYKNHLFSGSLVLRHLNILEPKGNLKKLLSPSDARSQFKFSEKRLFKSISKRIRNVGEAPDGRIYLSTDSGQIYEFTPN